MRASGWSALIGRKARPVSRMASAATICSTLFSITMATSASAGVRSGLQLVREDAGALGERGVGERLVGRDDGDGVGRGAAAVANTGVVQQVVGTGPAVALTRAISARSAAGTSERSVAVHASVVGRRAPRAGRHTRRTWRRAARRGTAPGRVPVDAEPALQLVDLVVEPGLRGLRDAVHHVDRVALADRPGLRRARW